jgi:hypothetical protein
LARLLQKVQEKDVVTRAEVKAAMAELDLMDGVEEGRLDVDVLKGGAVAAAGV